MKFTKIVATISDQRCDTDLLKSLFDAGMNVVRLNTAHLQPDGFRKIVANVRAVSGDIAIMIDTKGPEIRTTTNIGDKDIFYPKGSEVTIIGDHEKKTDDKNIYVNYRAIAADIRPGQHILIDDGELDFYVDSVNGDEVHATSMNDGVLGSRKSVNIPGADLKLASCSERDIANIRLGAELGVDFVAHSFVRSHEDVDIVKKHIDEAGGKMKVISKIENQQGVDNFDQILEASYGIMIARGDLGIEIAAERIPALQKMMIRKCIDKHKPVIVATQMLHSMIENPRPTRAEVSDVAAAVEQRADAIMLSGETAKGKYPVEAVRTMARIAEEIEGTIDTDPLKVPPMSDGETTSFLARQAVISQVRLGTKAILTDTFTGRTARYIASFRGKIPTFAICYRPEVKRWLALSYGITTFDGYHPIDETQSIVGTVKNALRNRWLYSDDLVAYLGGRPGEGNLTTFLEIDRLDHVIKP
ncbi:MAG: pyruvate kinase [Muribaculaceae bacterium]|nr:pyruvate kinase [Muribaculaceae bacterium]